MTGLFVVAFFALPCKAGDIANSSSVSTVRHVPPETPFVFAHWWVSPGERASVDVIKRYLSANGFQSQELAIEGSGTSRFGDVLRTRVDAGIAPAASQVIGFDINLWAQSGQLLMLNEVAQRQEWEGVIPAAIQALSSYEGHWYAVPINAHSTHWLWVNHEQFRRLGIAPPDSWPDFINMLQLAHEMGIPPIALGSEAWEHVLLFENVAAGSAGVDLYRKMFIQLEADADDLPVLEQIFSRMSQLRFYLAPGFERRRWDEATTMVKQGQALLQVQGTWVNGEFISRGMTPGVDFECFLFPDNQGLFLFNADQYMFFANNAASTATKLDIAAIFMQPDFQRELNMATGAAPARVDVELDGFNECTRKAVVGMRLASMQRTVLGSVAMGNANPPAVKESMYSIISDHLQGRLSDADAARQLLQAIHNVQL